MLDEPNSNLDAEGEIAVSEAVKGVRQRGGIALVVAHRPSAIAAVDTLAVMRGGEVVAFGPRDEVLVKTVQNASNIISHPAVRDDRDALRSGVEGDMTMLDTDAAIRRHLKIGLTATFLFGGTLTAWSLIAQLDLAVVAQGTVVVEFNVKKVQHPTGGVVGAIFVREGQRVAEGDVLIRLDETATRAALGIVVNELTATRARAARLNAERNGATHIRFLPISLHARRWGHQDHLGFAVHAEVAA